MSTLFANQVIFVSPYIRHVINFQPITPTASHHRVEQRRHAGCHGAKSHHFPLASKFTLRLIPDQHHNPHYTYGAAALRIPSHLKTIHHTLGFHPIHPSQMNVNLHSDFQILHWGHPQVPFRGDLHFGLRHMFPSRDTDTSRIPMDMGNAPLVCGFA